MILAEMSNPFGEVSGAQFVAFLACCWLLLKTVSEGTTMWGRFTGKEPLGRQGSPMHTQKAERTLSLAEWTALEKRVESLEVKFEKALAKASLDYHELVEAGEIRANRIMKALMESAGKQHARVDQILAAVSRLEGVLDVLKTKAH